MSLLETFLEVSQAPSLGNGRRREKLDGGEELDVTKKPPWTNSFCTLPSLLMQPRGGGGPSPSWLPRLLPRSRLPGGRHLAPGLISTQGSRRPWAALLRPRRRTLLTRALGPARPISLSLCGWRRAWLAPGWPRGHLQRPRARPGPWPHPSLSLLSSEFQGTERGRRCPTSAFSWVPESQPRTLPQMCT